METKSKSNMLFIVYAAVFLAAAQYNLYISITAMKMFSLTYFFIFLIFAVICFLFIKKGINIIYSAALIPAAAAVYIFRSSPMNPFVYMFFGFFVLLLFGGYYLDLKKGVMQVEEYKPGKKPYYAAAVWLVISLAVIIIVDIFYLKIDSAVRWYFPFRWRGDNLDGMMGLPFRKFHLLVPALFYALFVLTAVYMVFKGIIKNIWIQLALLVVFAFGGKLLFAVLGTHGFDIIHMKTISLANTTYYYFASRITDVNEFIANYVSHYQGYLQSSHLQGHPIMPVLFYWIIIKLFTPVPVIVGLVYSFTTALAVIPFYFLGRHLTKSEQGGFLTALLYALTPNSLVLSVAGTDGMVVLFTACFVCLAAIGADKNRVSYLIWSGVFFGIGTYFNFGIWPLLMYVFLMFYRWEAIATGREPLKESARWVRNIFAVMAGTVGIHLLFWIVFAGHFNYFDSFKMAQARSVPQMLSRPYDLWVWANFFHWAQFVTVPVMALFFLRFIKVGYIDSLADRFSIMSLAVIAAQFLGSLGRAETQRMYMFLIVFALPVAVLALLNLSEKGSKKIELSHAMAVTALVYINSVLIQTMITDSV